MLSCKVTRVIQMLLSRAPLSTLSASNFRNMIQVGINQLILRVNVIRNLTFGCAEGVNIHQRNSMHDAEIEAKNMKN